MSGSKSLRAGPMTMFLLYRLVVADNIAARQHGRSEETELEYALQRLALEDHIESVTVNPGLPA
jgi:hypothetical protein